MLQLAARRFEHVSSVVRSLSGLSCSSSSDSLRRELAAAVSRHTSHDVSETCPRYEFTEPAGWALLLSFDQSSGRLSGGSLEAPPRERGALHTHSR